MPSLHARFSNIPEDELESLMSKFSELDTDGDGKVERGDVLKLCKKTIVGASYDELLRACRALESSDVSIDDYLDIVSRLRRTSQLEAARGSSPLAAAATNSDGAHSVGGIHSPTRSRQGSSGLRPGSSVKETSRRSSSQHITRIAGATESSQHSIDAEEVEQFVFHINNVLQNDPDIGHRAPIDPHSHQLFQECQDGLVLCKLINDSAPESIDERALNKGPKLNTFQMTENNNLVINSAKAIGCSVVNIGSQDLIDGKEHLVLGLVWQIIKIGLLSRINLQYHPELYRLLKPNEALEDLLKLPADELLLRWFNYHLEAAGCDRRVTNFAGDIRDSIAYTVLLHQLCPDQCDLTAERESDLEHRAELVLQNAARIGCRKYVSVKAIVLGNAKLNLAFVANLFNHYPGLAPLTEDERTKIDDGLFSDEGDREARAFALWMNSLGVEPFVLNLHEDLKDGRILLQVFDRVRPGSIVWRRVNQRAPLSRFQSVENTNYCIELGKQWTFSLVGIQGADITDGNRKLTLGLVWQLMRQHILETLRVLSPAGSPPITEADLIAWANNMVSESASAASQKSPMGSFKDPSLRDSRFLLGLLDALKPNEIDYGLVTEGISEEDAKSNAKYAISVARKLGATIFLLPEDIVEVRPKMILTFVGTLMAIHQKGDRLKK